MSRDWKNARVAVTGGAGLIGSTICDKLVKLGTKEVLVLDNFSRGTHANLEWARSNGNISIHELDICDSDATSNALKGVDYVFHQAAIRITQCAKEPQLCVKTLINGTQNVLDACIEHKVKKVVMASSASVYGMAETFPTKESHHPYHNRTLYGASKAFGEGILRAYNDVYNLPYVALRYFNVYGPRMDIFGVYTEVLIRWLDCIESNTAPIIHGDGSQSMDFIYVADVAKANILAMESDASDQVFNVGTCTETTLLELWNTLKKICGSDLEPTFTEERAVNNVRRRLADVQSAEQSIGFKAEFDLEQGLRQLVEWRNEAKKAKEAA